MAPSVVGNDAMVFSMRGAMTAANVKLNVPGDVGNACAHASGGCNDASTLQRYGGLDEMGLDLRRPTYPGSVGCSSGVRCRCRR